MKASEILRKEVGKADKERDKDLQVPGEIQRYMNIAYDKKDSKWNLLDVYRPKESLLSGTLFHHMHAYYTTPSTR